MWRLILLTLVLGNDFKKDLYEILGVPKSASTKEIKRAYKDMAIKYHPDKNPSPEANDMFQEINYAKEILTDQNSRSKYDQCGHECLQENGNMGEGFDPFGMFSGFFQDQQQQHHVPTPKGDNVYVPISLTLEELYTGTEIRYTRQTMVPETAPGTRECNCRIEYRQIQNGNMLQMVQHEVCDECQNIIFSPEEELIEIEVQPGMPDGQVLFLAGAGEQHADGEAGDLNFVLHERPHHVFERVGDNLFINVTISLQDALIGFKTSFAHLNGRKVNIHRSGITWPGFRQKLSNEGMPKFNGGFGYLLITFDVQFPNVNILAEQKLVLSEIFSSETFEIRQFNGAE